MTTPDRKTEKPIDFIDAMLATNRQEIILMLMDRSQLDFEAGVKLYEATTRPDQVAADREAFEKNEFGPNSPSGRLGTLLFKLRPGANE